ncbi:MAG TPA: WD40 repeat domain-containing serine/threonine protein kinase, partial [Gemmatales bacterium]|nr:WD40 repeat domain-containing serine/threonine protein kinase [Gemmatales bacterium]
SASSAQDTQPNQLFQFNEPLHRPDIPNYEVLKELGRGGMGIVYHARDLRLKREVAIKMLLDPEFASPEQRLRFKIEAEAVAQLRHPNIVQVYELGELKGTTIAHPYMVLEYVDGPTLFRYMRQRTFTEREIASLVITLAKAIQHAHDHGLIHRDLKPANILIQHEKNADSDSRDSLQLLDFTPKITDFGLVKALVYDGEIKRDLTRPELMVGTPQYMAPEQANPTPHALSCSVDIYSLGVILYELLTGRLPFDDRDILRMLMEVQTQEPPSPRKVNPKISIDLATICLKCLSKHPEQRYPSALALAEDLGRYLRHEPIYARPMSDWQKAVKWLRRYPMVAGLLGTLFTVITMGLVVISAFWRDAEKQRLHAENESRVAAWASEEARTAATLATRAEQEAKQAEYEALRQQKLAQSSLYFSNIAQADLLLKQGQLARAINILTAARKSSTQVDQRSWEWYYLRQQCNTMEYVSLQANDFVQKLAFHPKSEILFSIDGAGLNKEDNPEDFPARLLLHKIDSATGERRVKVGYESPLPLRELYMLCDGELVLIGDVRKNLTALKLSQGDIAGPYIRLPAYDHHAVAESAGIVVFWNNASEIIHFFDISRGELLDSWTFGEPFSEIKVSRDGSRIALIINHEKVICLERATKKTLWTKSYAPSHAHYVKFSEDGTQLLCVLDNGRIAWEHLDNSKTLLDIHLPGYSDPSISKDGKALALIKRSFQKDDIHVYHRKDDDHVSKIPMVLHDHQGHITDVIFTENSQRLLSFGIDAVVRYWDVTDNLERTGTCLLRLSGHHAQVLCAAINPHAQTIATGSVDANIIFWRTDVGLSRDCVKTFDFLRSGGEWISDYQFVQDTSLLAIYQHEKRLLFLFDLITRKVVKEYTLEESTNQFRAPRYDIAFSPDGRCLAVLSKVPNQVLIYNTLDGKLLWSTPTSLLRYNWLAFSGDGKRLLAAAHHVQP